MSAAEELGPALPSRGVLRAKAQEGLQLILIILDETVAGGNLQRAADKMKKLQAVVGPPDGDAGAGSQL